MNHECTSTEDIIMYLNLNSLRKVPDVAEALAIYFHGYCFSRFQEFVLTNPRLFYNVNKCSFSSKFCLRIALVAFVYV